MTQSIVQGPEDPLLVLDHQGGSGNPSFLIQQDETAVAYIWWDQVNQVFNMGPTSVGSPSLSISSNGTVSMGPATANGLLVRNGATVNNGLEVDNLLVNGTATANGLLVQNGARVNNGLEVDNLLVNGTVTAGNYLVSSSKEIKQNITNLSSQEALEVLGHVSPVKFNVKADDAKKVHIGFIAENVHQSVASSDGKSIGLMDIVATLTRVVKEQQKTIDALVAKSH